MLEKDSEKRINSSKLKEKIEPIHLGNFLRIIQIDEMK